MTYRLRKSTIQRMRGVWWVNYSQIARAACRWLADGGVVSGPNLSATTCNATMPIKLDGVPVTMTARQLDRVVNAFLDTLPPAPERMINNGDGSVSCEAPADCVASMPDALKTIRAKTLAVKA